MQWISRRVIDENHQDRLREQLTGKNSVHAFLLQTIYYIHYTDDCQQACLTTVPDLFQSLIEGQKHSIFHNEHPVCDDDVISQSTAGPSVVFSDW